MRRTPGGPVYDRQEFDEVMIFPPFEGGDPNVHYHRGNRPFIREQLYNHFQNEKYRGNSLPRFSITGTCIY